MGGHPPPNSTSDKASHGPPKPWSRSMRRWQTAAVALSAGLSCGAPAAAQSLHGLIAYNHNDLPVALATVRLVDDAGTVLRTSVSAADGRFSLPIEDLGSYWVHVEHTTAFTMVDGPVSAGPNQSTFVVFHLVPRPIALEEIEVEVQGRSRHLLPTGFYERKRVSAAFFMDERAIERRRPIRASDLLRNIPGLVFLEGATAGFSGYPVTSHSQRNGFRRGPCFPRVYLDGAMVERGGTNAMPSRDFDDLVAASYVVGLEVYRSPAETPVQFGGLTSCGVILMWTTASR